MTAVPSSRPSLQRLNRFDRQLWNRFIKIAQPYWFPMSPHSGKLFFVLLMSLIVFLFGLLVVIVSAGVLLAQALFPEFMQQTAGGLVGLIQAITRPPAIFIVAATLLIPAAIFFLMRGKLMQRWQQWLFLGGLLLLSLSVSGMNVIISYVGNFFTTALSERDQPTFWRFFFVYAGVFVVATPISAFYPYVRDLLGLRWRDWMTQKFLGQYFRNRAYYEINFEADIDNPDQRISEDIKSFTATSLSFLLLVLSSVIDVVAFTGILWSLSKFLAVFLVAYAIIGTLVATLIGRRLILLNFNQLRREADFRYGLVHVRDNAESIAFYQGEANELGQLRRRFVEVLRNFSFLVGWQRNLAFFRVPYRYATYILPSVILAPMYFAQQITFGDITQAGFAFSQIFDAFALVVLQMNELSSFAAGINRLETFTQALDAQDQPPPPELSAIHTLEDSHIALEDVSLATPKGQRMLLREVSLRLQPEQGLVIVGHSGVGKSSLLRAIAGLWNTGTGQIVRPDLSEMLFLPQRPYMVLGTLRDQLLYPNLDKETSDEQLHAALEQVNLADLPNRVGGFDVELDWADVLSLGEQQRLAFARLVLTKPHYAMLDEATSALDLGNEQRLYQKLRDMGTTFVSVGHRTSLLKYHDFVLELSGDGTWKLTPTRDYVVNAEAFV
ncbi:MAG: ABC transporter ATP-binding protein/permease [Leptolyngbya sp. IPPAS B-1204]|nr:ABC transporter ATP-binding protein/permease [Elainella sp. C42_A2020_010]